MSSSRPSETSPLLTAPPSSSQHKISPQGSGNENEEHQSLKSQCLSVLTIQPRNRGLLLVLAAEIVGATMDATARFLQQNQGGKGISVFQVIFFRMSITWLLSSVYSWWTKVPDFPLGNPKVRGLLFARALFGSSGLFCLYYSVHYLTITEATIIRFLVPLSTTVLCSILLAQSFTSRDVIAGVLSLSGVVVMAHPEAIFGHSGHNHQSSPHLITTGHPTVDPVSPAAHIIALSVSLLGVFFAASAYTTIRLIGSQAHALISVSYFSALSTLFTLTIMLIHPTEDTTFVVPSNGRDWSLLIGLGVAGFVLQFLLTKGLQMDKSSRATSMLYLQVVFAGVLDWGVWGVLPGVWSWVGGGIVVASTLWLALSKEGVKAGTTERVKNGDEEEGLLSDGENEQEGEGEAEELISEDVIVRRASVSA